METTLYDRRLHVAVPAELAVQVRECAAREERKISEYVRDALREHVSRKAA